jgi:hypothetical protein
MKKNEPMPSLRVNVVAPIATKVLNFLKKHYLHKLVPLEEKPSAANMLFFVFQQKCPVSAIAGSLDDLADNTVLNLAKARAIAWRLAVNERVMRTGRSVPAKVVFRPNMRCVAKISDVQLHNSSFQGKPRVMMKLVVRLLTGPAAGLFAYGDFPVSFHTSIHSNVVDVPKRLRRSRHPFMLKSCMVVVDVETVDGKMAVTAVTASPIQKKGNLVIYKNYIGEKK